MLTENQYIIEAFEKNFSGCHSKRIVLYGKGPFTRTILETVKGFHIVGIMDRDLHEGMIYDLPVLSGKAVLEAQADIIIVVARPKSAEAVFRRIRGFCSVNHIQLYSINGENLFEKFCSSASVDEDVVFQFAREFVSCKNKKIVLYGKGPRTRMIVDAFPDYNILGLMDKVEKEGIYYGKRILSLEEVCDAGTDMIISVTREQTTPHVYNRIHRFCALHHIMLYDVNGNNLFEKYHGQENYTEQDPYFEIKEADLRAQIKQHEVVSFDIFDTLLMRKTMLPTDVFSIVGDRAAKKGIRIPHFKELRRKAEQESVGNHADIYDIYAKLQEMTRITDADKDTLLALEIETEKRVLIPRVKMAEVFEYAKSLGKRVCIISDMYLPGKILEEILENSGIKGYEKLYVSCDYKCSKGSGIYNLVKMEIPGASYLHIGDNKVADGVCAKNSGYDVFLIRKALDMLDISTYRELRAIVSTENERAVLGLILAKIFNDPFALYHSEGKPEVGDSRLFGYLFIAPLVTKFILWLANEVKERKYDDVLFSARDGYLIIELYREFRQKMGLAELPEGIYFPTSRLLSAAISRMTEEDIRYSAGEPRSYSPEGMLQRKFKLKEPEIVPYNEKEYPDVIEYALAHKGRIFKRSEETRESYYKYLERLGLQWGKRYGLFDFVSSGTCQYDMSRVVPFEIEGLYMCFYDIGDEHRRALPVRAMRLDNYQGDNAYTTYIKKSYFFENYVFLESVMTSMETSVEGIDEDGGLIYGEEHRTQEEIDFMVKTQQGIREYFQQFIDDLYVAGSEVSMDVADECYRYKDLRYTNEHCKELDEFGVFEDLGYGKMYFGRK